MDTTLIAAATSAGTRPSISTEVSSRTESAKSSVRPRVAKVASKAGDIVGQRRVGWQRREVGKLGTLDPSAGADGPELGDGTTGDGDRDLLATLGPSEDLAYVIS